MFSFELGASFKIHPAAQAAYDVSLAIGPPLPSGPCLWVSRPGTDGTPRLAVAGLGWLHAEQERIPVLELPAQLGVNDIQLLAWRETAAQLRGLSACPEQSVAFVKAVADRCPERLLGLFDLPRSRDVTALRRRLRLRRARFETPPEVDVFKDALRAMGVR